MIGRVTTHTYKLYTGSILNSAIHFDHCSDVSGYNLSDGQSCGLAFPNAKEIVLTSCDKNFTYALLYRRNFPQLRQIYLRSHPCDPLVFYRFFGSERRNKVKWTVSQRWAKFECDRIDGVEVRSDNHVLSMVKKFEHELLEMPYSDYLDMKHRRALDLVD